MLLSTFDLGLRQEKYEYYVEKFGSEKVVLVSRSFLFGMIKIFIPIFVYLFIIVLILWFTGSVSSGLLTYLGLPLSVLMFFVMLWRIGKMFLDYAMDFSIITPEEVISCNQTGILNRRIKTMQTLKIKTVSVHKAGLLFSLFDNGNIVVFAEGDQSGGVGEVNLSWVKSPEKIKNTILDIVETAKSAIDND